MDLKNSKIRVNAISPGPIDTPLFNSWNLTEEEIEQIKSNLVATMPIGRMGTPDEIAKAVSFLASAILHIFVHKYFLSSTVLLRYIKR